MPALLIPHQRKVNVMPILVFKDKAKPVANEVKCESLTAGTFRNLDCVMGLGG